MKINIEELRRLYVLEGLTDAEIGKRFSVSDVCVSQYRKKAGIPTVSHRDKISKQAIENGLTDIQKIDKTELETMYLKHGERKLGEIFGCSKQLIKTRLMELGINPLSKTDRILKTCPLQFTDLQKDILYGSLLGDGSLTTVGNSARFRECHCMAQKAYLEYKHSVLNPFSKPIGRADKEMPSGYVSRGFYFNTCFHPLFLGFYDRFYKDGEKILPIDFEVVFNPRILAVWYMDDGHLEGFEGRGRVQISSCFREADIARILFVLNEMGLEADSSFYPNSTKGINIIRIKNVDLFFSMTKNLIHSDFQYKIPERLGGKWKDKILETDVESWFYFLRDNGMSYPILSTEAFQKDMLGLQSSQVRMEDNLLDCPSVSGSKTCLSVFKNIYIAKRKGKKSATDVFEDDKLLRHCLSDCIKFYGKITETNLRQELRSFGGVNNFKPVLAKYIYDTYCPPNGKVLDPCSGWGGRLCGFMASKARQYTGVDVESESIKNLKQLFKKMNPVFPGKEFRCQETSFTEFKDKGYDLVFTSPPYFDAEHYGESRNQSQVRFPTYDLWLTGFLKDMIDRSWNSLNPDGRIILNVPARCKFQIYEDVKVFMPVEKELRIKTNGRYGSPSGFEWLLISFSKCY
ncbi:MAG: hypothetical protein M0P12_00900 [Paludibacteraceae bacterium]|nr:hypothetical protein [Paludibacteraceae bacterium]